MDRPRSFGGSVAHLSLAGYSAWDLPLSVAQHSLTVLAIRQGSPGLGLTPPEALRELLHDAEEALLGGWDPITPAEAASRTGL
jgi:5'-deoxynucleotidase YfbR-like HD superfamily hydrolase